MVSALAFSPDGASLAVGHGNRYRWLRQTPIQLVDPVMLDEQAVLGESNYRPHMAVLLAGFVVWLVCWRWPRGRRRLTGQEQPSAESSDAGEVLLHEKVPGAKAGRLWLRHELTLNGAGLVIAGWKTQLTIPRESIDKLTSEGRWGARHFRVVHHDEEVPADIRFHSYHPAKWFEAFEQGGIPIEDPVDLRSSWALAVKLSAAFEIIEGLFWVVLLDGGADVNAVDSQQRTPLMEAIDHDHPEMLDLLLHRAPIRLLPGRVGIPRGRRPCANARRWKWPNCCWRRWTIRGSSSHASPRRKIRQPGFGQLCSIPKKEPGRSPSCCWITAWTRMIASPTGSHPCCVRRFTEEQRASKRSMCSWNPARPACRQASRPRPAGDESPGHRGVVETGTSVRSGARSGRPAAVRAGSGPAAQPEGLPGAPRLPGAELDAYDRADAALAGLKTAATEPWFTELAGEVAEKLGCKPRPWKRRVGVLHFSAKLSRLPAPDDQDEADAEEIAELLRLEPLQQWVRQRGASLVYVESPSDARNITRLLLAPMTDWIAMLRMCGTNGANYGLTNRDISTWLAKTGERHRFKLQGCGHDFVAIRFTEPIDDYETLHTAIESFCPDISGDDPAAPAELEEFGRATGGVSSSGTDRGGNHRMHLCVGRKDVVMNALDAKDLVRRLID